MGRASEWEPDAENWVRWARTDGHDAYWYYRHTFFDSLLPPPGELTVEIGCGEGRVVRDLAAHGHRVIGVDSSPTLVRYARGVDRTNAYAVADGACLPFADSVFDQAVAYNSLQVVADMPGTVSEVARVLTSEGRLCVCISHPLADVGRFVDDRPDAPYVIRDDYFARRRVDDSVERDGLEMTFRGWTYSLEDYALAFEAAGLQIEIIREPHPLALSGRYARWSRVPMFLMMRLRKPRS
jgi:SAM-dependent methyltransferase